MEHTLIIKELHFDAAHYLDGSFGKCQNLHGHRWIIKELVVYTNKIVDFNKIKECIDDFDHCLIIPSAHTSFWHTVKELSEKQNMPFTIVVVAIKEYLTLVENLKENIKKALLAIDGITDVTFELYETPIEGVICQ